MEARPQDIAAQLAPLVADSADDNDANRALAPELVRTLKENGAFRQLIPAEFGGLGVAFPDYVRAIQTYAEADASTGWCINQGAVIGTTSIWLEPDAIREIWAPTETSFANGPPLDCAIQDLGDERYRLTGRWGFSSGCQHATWMTGVARVVDQKRWLAGFFPKQAAEFHDTWQVAGLRGTGSFEFSVDSLALDGRWVADLGARPSHDGAFFRIPTGLAFAVSFASVALGIARAGIDTVIEIVQGKWPIYAPRALRDEPDAQRRMGEGEIRWRAARAFLHDTVDSIWAALEHQDTISNEQRLALRMAGTHTIREAAAVFDLAYTVAGSTGIYQNHPLQRRFQDMNVVTQHVQARQSYYSHVGRFVMGHEFEPGPLN